MTGRALFSRCAFLTFCLIFAGALHLTLSLNANDIAKPFVQAYVPLDKKQAIKQAVNNCEKSAGFQFALVDCSIPSKEDILMQISRHREAYEYGELQPVVKNVRNVTDFALGSVYAALALGALWALIRWFGSNIWPKLAKSAGPLRTSLLRASLNLSERGAARRLRRAEEEFRTLKSLRDEGLITEDVFVARKNKLKAAIKS